MRRTRFFVFLFMAAMTSGTISHANTTDLESVSIHGFISQGFLKSDKNNFLADTRDGTFEFNGMGINFSVQPADNFRAGIQFFARDMGNIGNDKPIVDWAFADFRYQDWLGFRAGQLKTPFGFYNETRDIDMLRTSILLPQSVYMEFFRDILLSIRGGGVYGNVSLNALGKLGYQVLFGATEVDVEGGITPLLRAFAPVDVETYEVDNTFLSSLQWTPPFLDGFRLGYSLILTDMVANSTSTRDLEYVLAMVGRDMPPGSRLTLDLPDAVVSVYSIELIRGNLVVSGEFFTLKFEAELKELSDLNPKSQKEMQGWYSNIAYRVKPWLEIGFYYSDLIRETGDRDGKRFVKEAEDLITLEQALIAANRISGPPRIARRYAHQMWMKDYALSFRFDLNESWTVKLEGHTYEGAVFTREEERGEKPSKYWNLWAVKASYHF